MAILCDVLHVEAFPPITFCQKNTQTLWCSIHIRRTVFHDLSIHLPCRCCLDPFDELLLSATSARFTILQLNISYTGCSMCARFGTAANLIANRENHLSMRGILLQHTRDIQIIRSESLQSYLAERTCLSRFSKEVFVVTIDIFFQSIMLHVTRRKHDSSYRI